MSVLGMLAWCAAAVSLWLGARGHDGAIARAYRWLAGGAALYCAGLIISQLSGEAPNPAPGLSLADLPPLLALAAAAVGIAMLTTAEREGDSAQRLQGARPVTLAGASGSSAPDGSEVGGSGAAVLPGLADGYVMAVALLVIGWVTMFGGEFHRSGERPGTFLLALVHPLADLAVLGALLPMVTTPGAGSRCLTCPCSPSPWATRSRWASGSLAVTSASRRSCSPWSRPCCSAWPPGG